MAKYFLGSVGTAEAFHRVNGELEIAFVSKTLTDSSLNISITKDDIRGGTGAPIQFSFYHDPSVEITLTDIVFEEAYVEAQLGTKFIQGGNAYYSEEFDYKDGDSANHELDKVPAELNLGCGNSELLIWASVNGSEWIVLPSDAYDADNNAIDLGNHAPHGHYCLRYVTRDMNARIAEISSNIIPEELFLVITAPIFAGDACSASNGKAAGTITYEVPRFKLNGNQEFTMNMSSNQTMSLSGTALASQDGCDVNGGKLLRIITVKTNERWQDNVKELIVDEDCLEQTSVPMVYGLFKDGTVRLLDNVEDLTFSPALEQNGSGEWIFGNSGIYTITVKDGTISESVNVQPKE